MKGSVLFVISACLSLISFAQEKEDIIPFTLTAYNNISIRSILNEKDTINLMLHTAASDLALTEETTQRLHDLHFERADSVKSWGGAGNISRFSKSNVLQIGTLKWTDVPLWEDQNSGRMTDGKFGLNLFKDKFIEIDFDKKIIVLHNSLPSKAQTYAKLKLTAQGELLFIEADCTIGTTTLTNKFLIHSGYSGDILFDDKFVAENKIDTALKVVAEKSLKDAYGNVLKTKRAIMPGLVIGKEKFADVPVGFFQGAIGRQKMSIIGGDMLKRFNIIIDAKREYIYLIGNGLKGGEYSQV
jgi:hypothetical protein